MAEKQRFQALEGGRRLCANNCGFFGSPATLNLCSKCYRDLRFWEPRASPAAEKSPNGGTVTEFVKNRGNPFRFVTASFSTALDSAGPSESTQPKRCSACRKRVGLTGFLCRCGSTFCGSHRYPEQHECSFDYKAVGREAIARANPVVKALKLHRI